MLKRLEKKVSGTPKALQPSLDYAASAEQSKGNTAMAIGGMKALAGVGMGAHKLYGGGGTGGDAVFGDVSQYTPKLIWQVIGQKSRILQKALIFLTATRAFQSCRSNTCRQRRTGALVWRDQFSKWPQSTDTMIDLVMNQGYCLKKLRIFSIRPDLIV